MYADQPCGRFRLSPLCVAHQPHSHNPDWGGTPGGKTTVPRWLNVLAIPRRGEKDAPLFENVDSTFASSGGGAGAEDQPPTLLPLPLLLPRRRLQKRHPLALPRGRCRRSACFRCRRLALLRTANSSTALLLHVQLSNREGRQAECGMR